jgi:hypothetical protein
MLMATPMAISGSRIAQSVIATAPTAITTPTDVHTSVMRCRASASSAIELCPSDARSRTRATPKLTSVATIDTTRPTPTDSSGCGAIRRSTASYPIMTEARRISVPSKPLAKYSALL